MMLFHARMVEIKNERKPVYYRAWSADGMAIPEVQPPLYLLSLTLIPEWISNYIHYKVRGDILSIQNFQ